MPEERVEFDRVDRARVFFAVGILRRTGGVDRVFTFWADDFDILAFYGEQYAVYSFGPKSRKIYRTLNCLAIMGGSLAGAQVIWAWGDLFNGLVAIPNLTALVLLARVISDALCTGSLGPPIEGNAQGHTG